MAGRACRAILRRVTPDSPPTPPTRAADGRPYPLENRRVKAWGLAIIALSLPGWTWLANHPLVDRWFPGTVRDLAQVGAVFTLSLNLVAGGALVLASGLGLLRPLRDARGRWAAALAMAVMIVLYVAIMRLFRRSQQWEARDAADVRKRDPRPPVVYLRAFTDDGRLVVPARSRSQRIYGHAVGSMTLTSTEQELAFILQRVGPVIAIGKPGEALPELGAARLYVAHASWQQTVMEMLEQASLVPAARGRVARRVVEARSGAVTGAAVEGAAPGHGPARRRGGGHRRDRSPSRPAPRRRSAAALPAAAVVRVLVARSTPGDRRAGGLRRCRLAAVALALVAGGFGAHWFYLGDRRRGVRRLLLLPVIYLTMPYAWYEACRWLLNDERQFDELAQSLL